MFSELESGSEIERKIDMRDTRKWFVGRLWNITEDWNILHPKNWTHEATIILEEFSTQVRVVYCFFFTVRQNFLFERLKHVFLLMKNYK